MNWVRNPAQYAEHVVLRDGTVVLMRVARPDDEERVADLFRRASRTSLRLRFFAPVAQVSPGLIRDSVTVDFTSRASVVAVHGTGEAEEVVGIGTYVRLPRENSADVAFMVDDRYHGRGIGTLLLERLAGIAHLYGIYAFEADVLPENEQMLKVFRDSGYELTQAYDGSRIHVHFPMAGVHSARLKAELRERVAVAASLAPFFRPRSVAVVGASRDADTISGLLFRNLIRSDFRGAVYPINPQARSIAGVQAYPSLRELPEPPDLTLVAVPAPEVPGVVQEAIAVGTRALTIITAGFAELGPEGREREERLANQIRAQGLRLVGPNSMGLINTDPEVSLNASLSRLMPPRGRVGFLSQSGALGLSVLRYATDLGLGFSTFVSVGNKADVSATDLLQYWEEDSDTDLVLLYLESFGDPRRFARVARRVSSRKPILVVKSGRSQEGTRAAAYHSAATCEGEPAVEGLFAQAGVIRADTLEEMFDASLLLACQPLPRGNRVAVVSNSGGPAILCADTCVAMGLEMPSLPPDLVTDLQGVVPPGATPRNPLDLGPEAGPEEYERGLRAVLSDPGVDAAIVIYVPVLATETESVAAAIRRAAAVAAGEKPVAACFMGTSGVDIPGRRLTGPEAPPIPSYRFPEAAAISLGRVWAYSRWRSRPAGLYVDPPEIRREEAYKLMQRIIHGPTATAAAAQSGTEPGAIPGPENPPEADRERRIGAGKRMALAPAEVDELLAAYGIPRAPVPLPDGSARFTAMVVQDAVFGPLIGLQGFDAMGHPYAPAFRITPLTDVDAADLVRHFRETPALPSPETAGAAAAPQEDLATILLRLSAMVEDHPWLDAVSLPLHYRSGSGWVAGKVQVVLSTSGSLPAPPAAVEE